MPKKTCVTCGVEFDALGKAKTCSVECSKAATLEYRRKWRRQPKVKTAEREYARERNRRPEVKEASRKWHRERYKRPERKKYERERKRSNEYKKYMREYSLRPNRAKYIREYNQSVKDQSLAFARGLLAGKYPELIPADHKPCLLYTATCRETGRVLYIGITHNWERRQYEHAATHKGALWLPSADISIDVYPNRRLAVAAETVAIKEHTPSFNTLHNNTVVRQSARGRQREQIA
jgi:predicted GIY-YIG superfamily endonuclease